MRGATIAARTNGAAPVTRVSGVQSAMRRRGRRLLLQRLPPLRPLLVAPRLVAACGLVWSRGPAGARRPRRKPARGRALQAPHRRRARATAQRAGGDPGRQRRRRRSWRAAGGHRRGRRARLRAQPAVARGATRAPRAPRTSRTTPARPAGPPAGWAAASGSSTVRTAINAPAAWSQASRLGGSGGQGIIVAVLDSGVAYSVARPLRARRTSRRRASSTGSTSSTTTPFPNDEFGHGTFVASMIGERRTTATARSASRTAR